MTPTRPVYRMYRRASASVAAIFLVALGALLMVALYSQVFTATTAVGNEAAAARAQAAAESGLGILRHRIVEITMAHKLKGYSGEALLNDLADTLAGKLPAQVTTATDASGVAHIEIGTVSLPDACSFRSQIWLSQRPNTMFSLRVTGFHGRASRQVGLEFDKNGGMTVSAMEFPMASKTDIDLHSAATNVYQYGNEAVRAQKPAAELANSADGSDAYVLQWETDTRDLSGMQVVFPELPPAYFYEALDSYVGPGPGNMVQRAINVGGATHTIRRYSGGGTVNLSGSFTGVIFVKSGTGVLFSGDAVVNGMIIFEPGPGSPAGNSVLAFDRDSAFTLNFDSSAVQAVLGDAWNPSADYARYDWGIIAPQTVLETDKNQRAPKIINGGSVWIHDSGTNGNWKQPFSIDGGTMLLEGPYESNGTMDLRINPGDNAGNGTSAAGYSIAVDNATYWEF